MPWYMGLDRNNKPNGWSESPQVGYIEVSQSIRDSHTANPDYLWNGSALVAPPQPATESLASKQSRMWSLIKSERERRRIGGVLVGGYWFHTDDPSRIQHLGLTMMGASIPANLQWKTMSGEFVAMTQTLAGQIFQAVAGTDQSNFANAETHRLAMESLADPTGYSYSTGWAAIYEV